jgi:cation diffusion facilitator CzcD-associated flavoprotein CzcO
VLRCERHPGFSIRFGEGWQDILPGPVAVTESGEMKFDALIVATGFDVNLADREEVVSFRDAIRTWRQQVPESEARKFPEESRFPYLGDAFQLQEKESGMAPGIRRIHAFNWGATMSHGALAGDIPGLETGARRLAQGIARDLFIEDADLHWTRLVSHNEDELKPTRYFVPPGER